MSTEANNNKFEYTRVDSGMGWQNGVTQINADNLNNMDSALYTHINGSKNNPHNVTAEQVGLGHVENKSVEEIRSDLLGVVTNGNTGFVTGGDVENAIISYVSQVEGEVGTVVVGLDETNGKVALLDNTVQNLDKKLKDEYYSSETCDTTFLKPDQIATINGQSLTEVDNIEITGGSGDVDLDNYYTKGEVDDKFNNLDDIVYVFNCGTPTDIPNIG